MLSPLHPQPALRRKHELQSLEPYQKGSIEVDGVKISQDLADGMLIEDTTPTEFFNHPKEQRSF